MTANGSIYDAPPLYFGSKRSKMTDPILLTVWWAVLQFEITPFQAIDINLFLDETAHPLSSQQIARQLSRLTDSGYLTREKQGLIYEYNFTDEIHAIKWEAVA